MLKTLRRLYKQPVYDKGESINEFDTNINSGGASEEDMRNRAEELIGDRKPKKLPLYRDRWSNQIKPIKKEEEIDDREDYLDHVKQVCFICNHPIVNDIDRYMQYGNSCDNCSSRINDLVAKKITNEESMQLLLDRIMV